MRPDLEASIEKTRSLLSGITIPPQPSILMELKKEQRKPHADIHAIADIIGSDISVSAAALKTVNSPFFGLRREVSSIFQAVMLLGMNNMTNIVTGVALRASFGNVDSPFMVRFWEDSNRIAFISAYIAKKFTNIPSDEAYTMGLFLNCGAPLLFRKFTQYQEIYTKAVENSERTVVASEFEELGTAHTIAGYIICKAWQLPEGFTKTVLHHHDADVYFSEDGLGADPSVTMLAIMKIAEYFCAEYSGVPSSFEWNLIRKNVVKFIGIQSEKELEAIKSSVFELLDTAPV